MEILHFSTDSEAAPVSDHPVRAFYKFSCQPVSLSPLTERLGNAVTPYIQGKKPKNIIHFHGIVSYLTIYILYPLDSLETHTMHITSCTQRLYLVTRPEVFPAPFMNRRIFATFQT